jgi:hypothetical protein
MIEPEKLVVGLSYFILRFFDTSTRFPKIDTMVYVGKNCQIPGHTCDTDEFFFQDPVSYSQYGVLLEHDDENMENEVIAVSEDDLYDFFDLSGLIQELYNLMGS